MDRNTRYYVDMTAGDMLGDQPSYHEVFQRNGAPQGSGSASVPAFVPPARPTQPNFVTGNPYSTFETPGQSPGRPGSYAIQPFVSENARHANHFPIQGVESPPLINDSSNNVGYPGTYQPYPGYPYLNQAQGHAPIRPGPPVPRGYQSTRAQNQNIGWHGTANVPIDLTEDDGYGFQSMAPQNPSLPVNPPLAASPQPTGIQPVKQGRAKKAKPAGTAKRPRQSSPPAGPSTPTKKGKKAVSNADNKAKKAAEEAKKSNDAWEKVKNQAKAKEEASSGVNPRQASPNDPTDETATGNSKGENGQTNKADEKGGKEKRKRGDPKRYDVYAPGNRTKMARMQNATRLFMGSRSFKAPNAVLDSNLEDNDGAETLGANLIQQAERLVASHGDIAETTMTWWNKTWNTKITAPELTETVKRMLEIEQKKKEANASIIVVDLDPIERVYELRKKMGKEDLFRDLWKEVKEDHSSGYSREVWTRMSVEDRQATMVLNAYQTLDFYGLLSEEEVDGVQAYGEKWAARAKDPNWTGPSVNVPEPERIEAEKQAEEPKQEQELSPEQGTEKAPQLAAPSKGLENVETTEIVVDKEATKPAPEKPLTGNEQKKSRPSIGMRLSNVPKPLKHKKMAVQNTTSHEMENANTTTTRLLNDKDLTDRAAQEEEEDPETLRQSDGKYSWETAHLENSEKTNQSNPEAESTSKDPSTAKNGDEVNAGDEGKMPPPPSRKRGGTLGRPRGSGVGSRGGQKKAVAVKKEDNGVENFLLGVKDGEKPHKVTKTRGRGRGRGRGQGGGRGTKGPTTKRMTKKEKEAAAAAAAAAEAEEAALAEVEATLLAEMHVDLAEDEKEENVTADTPNMAPTVSDTPDNTFIEPKQSYNASSSEESDADDDEAAPFITPTHKSPPYIPPPSDAPLRKRPTTRPSGVDPYAYIAVPNAQDFAAELAHKARDWQAEQQAAERQAKRDENQKQRDARKAQSDKLKELKHMRDLAKIEEEEKREEAEAKKANKPKRVQKTQKRKRAEDEDDMTEEMKIQDARKKLLKEYGFDE